MANQRIAALAPIDGRDLQLDQRNSKVRKRAACEVVWREFFTGTAAKDRDDQAHRPESAKDHQQAKHAPSPPSLIGSGVLLRIRPFNRRLAHRLFRSLDRTAS